MTTTASISSVAAATQMKNRVAIGAAFLFSAVSVALSLLVVVAIALPLIREPKNRTRAASFNFYLILMSTADLMMALVMAVLMGDTFYVMEREGTEDFMEILELTDGRWTSGFRLFFSSICTEIGGVALVWVAAFVCHGLLGLLRNSKQRKHCQPPTLRTAILQGLVALGFGLLRYSIRVWGSQWFHRVTVFTIFGPILYSLWVAYRVAKERLTRVGAGVGNRLRVLIVYFARIILVYAVGICFMAVGYFVIPLWVSEGPFRGVVVYTNTVFWGLQGWVSFAIIVTKPDVGQMVRELLFANPCCCNNQTGEQTAAVSFQKRKENTNHDGTDDKMERQEGNGNNDLGLSADKNTSRKSIDAIVDYLSCDEDDDDNEDANDKVNCDVDDDVDLVDSDTDIKFDVDVDEDDAVADVDADREAV